MAWLLGPLLWILALIGLAVVVRQRQAVEVALLVALASFLIALVYLAPQRAMRIRRERRE